MKSTDGKIRVASISYGKDSLGQFGAIEQLGWPVDGAIHAEVWATDDIPADLPEMVEFKAKADKILLERYGIEVKRAYAKWPDGRKQTFENVFFKTKVNGEHKGTIYGWPMIRHPWCNLKLKLDVITKINETYLNASNVINYIGIAADEINRLPKLDGIRKISPLAAAGWRERRIRLVQKERTTFSQL